LISLIIPHSNQLSELLDLLSDIDKWDLKPDEIIVIDSSNDTLHVNKYITEILIKIGVKFQLIHRYQAYPGAARNIGIKISNGEFVAFLDVKTIPQKNWLASAMNQLSTHPDAGGVFGSTQYTANNYIAKLIRMATYGLSPIRTLPGSLFRRDTIYISGQFIESTRAGEDADWMIRLNLHKLKILNAKSILSYDGLDNITLPSLLQKWFRNYKHAAKLPYLYAHKSLYYHALVILLLFVAFNWNWVVAGWNSESDLYIPHFTKIVFFSILISYIFIRGIWVPIKKGATYSDLIPLKWILVACISAVLDITKTLAFLRGRWLRE
jgi:glycosyltransferase involved in cell wall biosynthesis